MKTKNQIQSVISKAFIAVIITVCFAASAVAGNRDTTKMTHNKMSHGKMKKMSGDKMEHSKMSKDKMGSKKMDKMQHDKMDKDNGSKM